MNKLLKHIKLISFLSFILPTTCYSADIYKADKQFTSEQFALAKQGYLEAAKLGNPHAYYQLGTIYSKGLGVEKDQLNALVYFSLAAEYNFHNAEKIVKNMLSNVPDSQQKAITDILASYREKHGKQRITQQYFPELNTENLSEKITFAGQDSLDPKFFSDDIYDENLEYEDNSFGTDEEELFNVPLTTNFKPFLIVDHDIGKDGSKRNITDVQKRGTTLTLVDEYSLFPLPVPMFKGQATEFIHRSYMGSALYSKFSLHGEDENLYRNVITTARKLKGSTDIKERFQYLMALQNFTWLEQQENEVTQGLLELAKQGHSGAMFEYGLKLYREQTDIEQAVHWISEASKYGLARAEYRLGKLLTTSPWVKKDEKKALFWFESAIEKDHEAAALKAIELRLTAADESLRDNEIAIEWLDKIASKQGNNPEYYYLLALSHKDRKDRDFTQVIENLEKAIFMGQTKNWDTAEWKDLLSQLTQGSVTIVED